MERPRPRRPCTPKVNDHSPPFGNAVNADEAWLFAVLQELGSELARVNEKNVLREGRSLGKKDSSKLDNSSAKVKHREAEKRRRAAVRFPLDQITRFFLVQEGEKISIGDLLLFGKSTSSKPESTGCLLKCLSCHLP